MSPGPRTLAGTKGPAGLRGALFRGRRGRLQGEFCGIDTEPRKRGAKDLLILAGFSRSVGLTSKSFFSIIFIGKLVEFCKRGPPPMQPALFSTKAISRFKCFKAGSSFAAAIPSVQQHPVFGVYLTGVVQAKRLRPVG